VNSHQPGIIKFVVPDRSLTTYMILWQMIRGWACFSDGVTTPSEH